jgi:hypothetical protein
MGAVLIPHIEDLDPILIDGMTAEAKTIDLDARHQLPPAGGGSISGKRIPATGSYDGLPEVGNHDVATLSSPVILSREDGEGSQITQTLRIERSFAVFAAQDDGRV